jgi:MFS family permease
MLDLFRALQGLGAAFVFPSCTAVLAHEFRGAERAKVFGILGSVLGIGLALGPLLGSVLTSWLGWRAIFLVNVPIGFGVLALAIPKMSESSDPRRRALTGLV